MTIKLPIKNIIIKKKIKTKRTNSLHWPTLDIETEDYWNGKRAKGGSRKEQMRPGNITEKTRKEKGKKNGRNKAKNG